MIVRRSVNLANVEREVPPADRMVRNVLEASPIALSSPVVERDRILDRIQGLRPDVGIEWDVVETCDHIGSRYVCSRRRG